MKNNSKAESRALALRELSLEELRIVSSIEEVLNTVELGADLLTFRKEAWARIEDRFPRVILLDGDRGTGKTSLMLTLADRWRPDAATSQPDRLYEKPDDGDNKPTTETRRADPRDELIEGLIGKRPTDVYVLPILDFDSLPPGMPVIGGILQAWRALSEAYADGPSQMSTDDLTVEDEWHRLFQTAAAGWGNVSDRRNLIDQVLDQEEQVKDWQSLSSKWQEFVGKIIRAGQEASGPFRLGKRPIFVVMIDDCDLQVERLTELLPAVRLLYSYNVFFILSAHRLHLLDMLKLGILGRQNSLGSIQNYHGSRRDALTEQWAHTLAQATFEKVFPVSSRYRLSHLSLSEYLNYPYDRAETIGDRFRDWKRTAPSVGLSSTETDDLSAYLKRQSIQLDGMEIHFPVATYRTAKQAFDFDQTARIGTNDETGNWEKLTRQAEAIARIISGSRYDDLIRLQHTPQVASGAQATKSKAAIPDALPNRPRIEFLESGRVEAFFRPELSEPLSVGASIQLSARPAFWKGEESDRKVIAGEITQDMAQTLLAISLQDDRFGVSAPALQWEIRLGLAWTEHTFPERLSFAWPLYEHPSPLRLIGWAREWRGFLDQLRQATEGKIARMAFGWLYYQLKWCSSVKGVPEPFHETITTDHLLNPSTKNGPWAKLLKAVPGEQTGPSRRWKDRVLPLMALPEIGLPPNVQNALLEESNASEMISTLRLARDRFITDSLIAARALRGELVGNEESDSLVAKSRTSFDGAHKRTYDTKSPWEVLVGPSDGD